MAAWIIYTADHDYHALAVNDECRDRFLEELAITHHAEGYAERYPIAPQSDAEIKADVARWQKVFDRAERFYDAADIQKEAAE